MEQQNIIKYLLNANIERKVNTQGGYVTVETALSVFSLILLFSLIMAGMNYGVAKIHSCHTLRTVARSISLGRPLPKLSEYQELSISEKGDYVQAVISQPSLLSGLKLAPPVRCQVLVIPEPQKEVGAF